MSSLGALIGNGGPQPPDTTDLTSLLGHISRETHKTLRKALPAQVQAVRSGNRVDVLVGFKSRYNDGTVRPYKIVPKVPVCMPQGQGYAIRLPVSVGDNGLLIIADRCLDTWLAGDGAPADPSDPRLHDLTDAIFIPGILTDSPATAAGDTGGDLIVQNGAATLHVQKAGTYRIANQANELVALTQQLAVAVDALVGAVGGLTGTSAAGPVTFMSSDPTTGLPSPLKAVVGQIASVATKISTLKGS